MRYKAFLKNQLAELEYKDIPALSEKEWKLVNAFGEDASFEIKTTSSSIDGINLINDSKSQTIPYITRTDANNGISKFVSPVNMGNGFDEAGCITVGLDTQTAFYQTYDFVTGQNIQIVTSKHLNIYTAMFLIPIFKKQMVAKFNWGGNGATLGRMKKLQMMLPMDSSGKPDWDYMEQYSKNLMLKKYQQYLDFLAKQEK